MPKKKYSAEYKAEAVKLVQSGERSQAEVCRNLGISSSTISQWCKNVTEPAVTKEESAKVKALESEIRRLKLEQEILKKATAFFAKNQQ